MPHPNVNPQRGARTATNTIKSRLKSGKSKRALSPSGTGISTRFKTKQGAAQASSGIRKTLVARPSGSAPEGNRASNVKKTATVRKPRKK